MVDTQKCFRLFDLPSVPLKNVIKCFEVFDLFDLSLCSNESKEMIKSTYRKVLEIDIEWKKRRKSLQFKSDNSRGIWVSRFVGLFAPLRHLSGPSRLMSSVSSELFSPTDALLFSSRPDIMLKVVLSRMKEIFDCHVVHIDIITDGVGPLTNCLAEVERCERLKCFGKISNENLKFILEKVQVCENLHLSSSVDSRFRCNNAVFNAKHVYITTNTSWLTPNNLLSSDCETMVLEECNFPLETYELFLNSWLEGSRYQRLKYLKVVDINGVSDLEVLKSRGTVWNSQQRGKYFIKGKMTIDCSEGIDILRSDGTIATILSKYKKFEMFVWHERFPELTEKHKIE